jgi:hypothetical protein
VCEDESIHNQEKMTNMRLKIKVVSCFVLLAVTILALRFCVVGQTLTAEQILANHVEALGKKENRGAISTLFAAGLSEYETKSPVVKGRGKAVVISDATNLYFLMSLNSHDYPYEKIGAFGNKVSIPFINAGNRSLLGGFLNEHPRVLLDSLFCGSMSLRWIAGFAKNKMPKMKVGGLKKIDGRETYAISLMSAEQGADTFKVRLYFDAENFRHVRSEYQREVKVGRIVFGEQNQLADGKLALTEEFSDFKDVGGLTLPHQYKVTFSSNSNAQMYESSWRIRVTSYFLNQKLAPDFFTFDLKD